MAQSDSKKAIKRMTSSDTRITKIKSDAESKPNFYVCTSCGKHCKNLNEFPSSQSELHAGWNYHLPVCKSCVDKLYIHYVDSYNGDEKKAVKRICELFDIYYNDSLFDASNKIGRANSRISNYISKWNLFQYKHKTYDLTLDEERDKIIINHQEFTEKKSAGETDLKKVSIERWGYGVFSVDDYAILEEHYKMLKKNNPNADNNQEIFIKSLCHINLLMMKALKEKDLDGYTKANAEYGKTFKLAGLKTIEERDSSNTDTVGVTLAVISQFTPEEFYKDKALYSDYDELGEYYDRHIRRPMQNLITGSDIRDHEFKVPDEDIGGDIDE